MRRLCAVLSALLLSSCVSTVVQPVARADLMVARAGDQVQLEWASTPGILYTITCSDTLGAGARWVPLPQAVRLRGTGKTMALSDQVPEGRARFYNVVMEPAGADAAQRSRATKTPNSGR